MIFFLNHKKLKISVILLIGVLILFGGLIPFADIVAQDTGSEFDSTLSPSGDHKDAAGEKNTTLTVEKVRSTSITLATFASIGLFVLIVLAFVSQRGPEYIKKIVFILMTGLVAIPTLYFIASTIYINVKSETKGPVHWHADYRLFACGEELFTAPPTGFLSNKTGTPVLHEHDDNRIHVEGVLIKKTDATLENFFKVQDSFLTKTSFAIKTPEGVKEYTNTDLCPDGTPGTWQTFVYSVDGEKVLQRKLENYTDYVLSPHEIVPPGDCIIIEFGRVKNRTEHLCDFYDIEITKGNLTRE